MEELLFRCSYCGHENLAGSYFCIKCGKPLPPHCIMSIEELKRLRNEKRYEEILGVREDATKEDLDRALIRFRKKYESDSEALLIGTDAYNILIDENKRKKAILWRWLTNRVSTWEEDTKIRAINGILSHPELKGYDYLAFREFLNSDRAIKRIIEIALEVLGITPVEGRITKDEQKEGCELHFKTITSEVISISVPPRIGDGEIMIMKRIVIRIKVIPRDAREILNRFVYELLPRLNFPPDLLKRIVNDETAIEYVRGGVKEGWSDERIIGSMISNVIQHLKPTIEEGSYRPRSHRSSASLSFGFGEKLLYSDFGREFLYFIFFVITFCVLYYISR